MIEAVSRPSAYDNIADISAACQDRYMIEHRRLTKVEFRECFAMPMRNMSSQPEVVTDIWPYVDEINPTSEGVRQFGDVSHVYRDGKSRYDQVLIQTDAANVFLVIVVDLTARAVFGHHLLDLNIEYGTAAEH